MPFSSNQNTEQNTANTALETMTIKSAIVSFNFCLQKIYTTCNRNRS